MTDKESYSAEDGRLVAEYLAYCERQRHPPNTLRARRRVLTGAPVTGTREQLEAWWETRSHLAATTLTAELAILRRFYAWADKWEKRDPDVAWPCARLEAPRVHAGLPRPVSRADLDRVLAAVPADLGRAVRLGAWAGLRVSETAKLMWPDVDIEQQQLRVVDSKGGHSRVVAVDFALIDALGVDTGRNVVTGTGHVYTAGALQRRCNRAIRAAGVDATFHQLRHRFGTLAYRSSRDLLAVGRAMGHRSVASTTVYAEPSDDVARQIAAAVTR